MTQAFRLNTGALLCLATGLYLSPWVTCDAAELAEPIILRRVETPSLQSVRSFEVEAWRAPFSMQARSMRDELTETLRTALLAETALPKASPAEGRILLQCMDLSLACKVVSAEVRLGDGEGPVIWHRTFNNQSWRSPWSWFVFKGWRRPEAVAAEIVAALKADYGAVGVGDDHPSTGLPASP